MYERPIFAVPLYLRALSFNLTAVFHILSLVLSLFMSTCPSIRNSVFTFPKYQHVYIFMVLFCFC